METVSGKDTLYDTVGIVYQSVSEEISRAAAIAQENRPSASGDSSSSRKKTRRIIESVGADIEPYYNKSIELMPLGCLELMPLGCLPTGRSQQLIVDDSVQHSPKVYFDVGCLECTTSS